MARAIANAGAELVAAVEQPDFASQSRCAKAATEEATRLIVERQVEASRASNRDALERYGERQVEDGLHPSH
eukprot:6751553-Prymnesium_polylepis.1